MAAEVDRPAGDGNASNGVLLAVALRFGGTVLPLAVYRFMNLFRATFPAGGIIPPLRPLLRTDRSWASRAKMGSFISSEEEDDDDDDSSDEDDAAVVPRIRAFEGAL